MRYLLDASVLIPNCFPDHIHYKSACNWLAMNPEFSVCPITEGSLVRYVMRSFPGNTGLALQLLKKLSQFNGFEFWPDDISYVSTNIRMIAGHKQLTDAYLVALAKSHNGRLATFDTALAVVHPDAQLVPIIN